MQSTILGAAAEYAASLFKGEFTEDELDFTAGTTAQELLKDDPERVFYVIINLSANACNIAFGSNPSGTRGIKLASNGGAFSLNARDDLTFCTKQVRIVADAANSEIYAVSVRRFRAVEN